MLGEELRSWGWSLCGWDQCTCKRPQKASCFPHGGNFHRPHVRWRVTGSQWLLRKPVFLSSKLPTNPKQRILEYSTTEINSNSNTQWTQGISDNFHPCCIAWFHYFTAVSVMNTPNTHSVIADSIIVSFHMYQNIFPNILYCKWYYQLS